MATASAAKQGDPIGTSLFTVTEAASPSTSVSLSTVTGSVLMIEIDNTGNSTAVYLNLYDLAGGGAVTPGGTLEDYVFMAPASSRVTYACPDGAVYTNGLWAAIVATQGTATGPTSPVTAYILINT